MTRPALIAAVVAVVTTACGSGSDVCARAAQHLSACAEVAVLPPASCGPAEQQEAELVLGQSCAAYTDPGKADSFGDALRCSWAGRQAGMCNKVAADDNVLVTLGLPRASALDANLIRVLVWNSWKAENPAWDADLERLAPGVDVALLQEFYLDADSQATFGRASGLRWVFATSFLDNNDGLGIRTGVVTGAAAAPSTIAWRRSPDREPVSSTPKMTLYTTYQVRGWAQALMVLNAHAINFRETGAFERHVDQMVGVLGAHVGPVVVGGDFNTWLGARQEYLDASMASLGLTHVAPADDQRDTVLDHVYVRGATVRSARMLNDVTSSDHTPIAVELSIP